MPTSPFRLRVSSLFAVLCFLVMLHDTEAQRLPQSVKPQHYKLRLTPDLKTATFTGEETVDVVISDLRFKPKDRSAYEFYVAEQKKREEAIRKGARAVPGSDTDAGKKLYGAGVLQAADSVERVTFSHALVRLLALFGITFLIAAGARKKNARAV